MYGREGVLAPCVRMMLNNISLLYGFEICPQPYIDNCLPTLPGQSYAVIAVSVKIKSPLLICKVSVVKLSPY